MDLPPPFLREAARRLNAGEARALVLSGNVADLYPVAGGDWVPLPDLLRSAWQVPGRLVLTYEINGPIRFASDEGRRRLRDAWVRWRTGLGAGDLALQRLVRGEDPAAGDAGFDDQLLRAVGKPTVALELLRQFCCCSRETGLADDLLIIVEAADLILPTAAVASLGDADRHRLHICHDWFADPAFNAAEDAVVLITESRSSLNDRVTDLPQVLEVAVPDPDAALRRAYVDHAAPDLLPVDRAAIAAGAAGLSIQALRQLLAGVRHDGGAWDPARLVAKVEEHLLATLGHDTISFTRPAHRLADVVGFTRLKAFCTTELVPRIQAGGDAALAGAAVCGPIGAGKTFLFTALAGELGMPVLEIRNLRSQWFGQTDVLFERLRRALAALDRVVVLIDEADTQFGGVGPGAHDTERRLTGRLQQMMSDSALLGRVFWLLMTARIEALSPDLRRPGRAGDLVIPVLDPEGDDRAAFVRWVLGAQAKDTPLVDDLTRATASWSAADFAALRRELAAARATGAVDAERIRALVADRLPPELGATRRRQTLQALLHCSRRSLLPDPTVDDATRAAWRRELATLEP